jgi:ketosteroid isomerase-like protein
MRLLLPLACRSKTLAPTDLEWARRVSNLRRHLGDTARAMSQENVEIMRFTVEAWNARDMHSLGELYDPEIVVRWGEGWPEGSESTMGRAAVVRQWEQQRAAFDEDRLELLSFTDLGDRVVARQLWQARGSGPDLSMEFSTVNTFRNGKLILLEFFWNHADALEALGLSE